jgi:hypothetical protein
VRSLRFLPSFEISTLPRSEEYPVLVEHCERRCGTFHRSLNLTHAIDPEKARAESRHGTCRISLPKKLQPVEQGKEAALSTGGSHIVIHVTVS